MARRDHAGAARPSPDPEAPPRSLKRTISGGQVAPVGTAETRGERTSDGAQPLDRRTFVQELLAACGLGAPLLLGVVRLPGPTGAGPESAAQAVPGAQVVQPLREPAVRPGLPHGRHLHY